jgi:hypothetical protein
MNTETERLPRGTDAFDIIGDIHGQIGKLKSLLEKLGYRPLNGGFRHPGGRKVIFLGDYIDRGPAVREVLRAVKAMVDGGDALAIMGNHEYNIICYHTPDGKGGWLRPHTEANNRQVTATLRDFEGREEEWRDWLGWMKRLPVALELEGLRCVHACWDGRRMKTLAGRCLTDENFLRACATAPAPEHRAIENVLKGPELRMPDGFFFHDKEGIPRKTVRVRWWEIPAAAKVSHLAMPVPFDAEGDAAPHDLSRIPSYGPGEIPVFFGHYWMPPDAPKVPIRPNLACLDFGAGIGGPLTAYRWDGEQTLRAEKFVY